MRIHDLAKHLNISIGTVSRALNGKPDVNPETRKRVLAAARELGYAPNQSGRSLRKGTTGTVAFVAETSPQTPGESAAFFMTLYQGIQSVTDAAGLDLIVLMCPANQDPEAFMRRAVARGVADGFMLSATRRRDRRISFLREEGIPFVTLGRSLTVRDGAWVDIDFHAIAAEAVTRLAALGRRRIALSVSPGEANFVSVSIQGYRTALRRLGLPFDRSLILTVSPDTAGGFVTGRSLAAMDEPPDGLILGNDLMAEGLFRALQEAGLQPGREIAVVGQRRISQNAYLNPTLASFDMSVGDMGQGLAIRLLRQIPAYAAAVADLAASPSLCPIRFVEGASIGLSCQL
ncbi:LacI family DNA-binding transcriptional regulator [Aureimonas pseudogalii]|uniref:DNA-binding LacI/PurR family transcriptional regulator n=1 Tax=Aureimonas pseudogalii TaxID=1744844 RepID=A0A7W6MME9_9HYPH|nr:LacI family DNA-binding transcriptional regulator [Aureimonas pseudogalii]MBB4000782.1 DNA-binding LacI/PurR family transcriptional regulator [Aureimonas pseudogalii]